MEVFIKKGVELSQSEIEQIDEAKKREFGVSSLKDEDFSENIFFLLIEEGRLFALGGLITIEPVLFGGGGICRGYGQLLDGTFLGAGRV